MHCGQDLLSLRSSLFVLVAGLQLFACGDNDVRRDVDAATDADTVDADIQDTDADQDAGDAGEIDSDLPPIEPLRQLIDRPLFGDMPIRNRVYDPGFSVLDAIGWTIVGTDYSAYGYATRIVSSETPDWQPGLHIPRGGNPPSVQIIGRVRSVPEPLMASVWIGREDGDDDVELSLASASLMGFFLEEGVGAAVDLSLDETTEPIVRGGVIWRRFVAMLDEGPVAWAYLTITDESREDFYIAAPVVIEQIALSNDDARLAAPSISQHRALRPAELTALETIHDLLTERFRRPRSTNRTTVYDSVRGRVL